MIYRCPFVPYALGVSQNALMPFAKPKFAITTLASTFVFAVCLSIVAVDGWRTINARRIQLSEGETAANNLARSIAQHAVGTLKEADAVTLGLVDRLESEGTAPASIEKLHVLLLRHASTMPQLQRLSIIGRDGHWLTTSRRIDSKSTDVSGRDYFEHHRDNSSKDGVRNCRSCALI